MGQDKGKMLLDKKPMVLHILEQLENQVHEVILVLRDDEQVEDYQSLINNNNSVFTFELKLVTDKIKNQGPLAGIYTGLNHISSDYGLIIPCDSPYISDSFLENVFHILENSEGDYDALVPQWDTKHLEPLHSIYHKRIKDLIEKQISNETWDVKSLIEQLNVFFVDVKSLDHSLKSFKNLNQPQDLKE